MKAWQLLRTKKQWCQGAYARDEFNHPVSFISENAVSWCVGSAIDKCYTRTVHQQHSRIKLFNALGKQSLTEWNDAPARKFSEVKALLKKFDI